jgi:hypothetical protein
MMTWVWLRFVGLIVSVVGALVLAGFLVYRTLRRSSASGFMASDEDSGGDDDDFDEDSCPFRGVSKTQVPMVVSGSISAPPLPEGTPDAPLGSPGWREKASAASPVLRRFSIDPPILSEFSVLMLFGHDGIVRQFRIDRDLLRQLSEESFVVATGPWGLPED